MATSYELAAINSIIEEDASTGEPCSGCQGLRYLRSRSTTEAFLFRPYADLARDHMYQRHPDEYHERRAYHAARTNDDQSAKEITHDHAG